MGAAVAVLIAAGAVAVLVATGRVAVLVAAGARTLSAVAVGGVVTVRVVAAEGEGLASGVGAGVLWA